MSRFEHRVFQVPEAAALLVPDAVPLGRGQLQHHLRVCRESACFFCAECSARTQASTALEDAQDLHRRLHDARLDLEVDLRVDAEARTVVDFEQEALGETSMDD